MSSSSPAILPISNPQSTVVPAPTSGGSVQSQGPVTTPAFRAFINHLSEYLRHGLSQRRPWAELADRTAFSKPESFSEATLRIRKNYSYFRVNYLAVIALILGFSLVSHPFSLILLAGLLSSWLFLYLFRPSDQPLVLFGRTFKDSETLILLVVLSVFVVFLTSVGSVLVSALMVGVALVCAHGAFRVPEDLFLDEQENVSTNASRLAQKGLQSAKASPQQVILNDVYSLRTLRTSTLVDISARNKISWNDGNNYNKRWQFKWKHAYYTYPKDGYEHENVKKPEDTKLATPLFGAWIADVKHRVLPGLNQWWERRHRVFDPFQLYVLPGLSLSFYMLSDITFGFQLLSVLPWFLFYTRLRDRTLDPDLKETYLRDMLYKNAEFTKFFTEETMHIIDYDCEFDREIDYVKFPEYNNSSWKFFNTDTGLTTGFFKLGDVETGATATLKFKTMPAPGRFRYQVGEPFYFYDLRADVLHNGVYQEIVLVDEAECLKRIRPFLYLV